jgi:NAD(P)-dependent dehydrogenase (short-subunit alcohol dehydrogenase family)
MDLGIRSNAALVTASSSGLGKASALALAREGANVVVNGRDEARLESTVEDLREEATGRIVAQPGDLTAPSDIEAMVERTVEEFGGLDHLVTSAGGPPSGPFLTMDDGDWYDAYDLLVMSVVRLVRLAADHLKAGGGTIVTITSRTVKEALDSLVLSNSVRMGVIGLEKTLSKELAPEVRANAVLPGIIETARITEIIDQALERGDYETYEEGLADWSADIPLARVGEPIELGDMVAFLSSERSSYINGTAIPIDGGSISANL